MQDIAEHLSEQAKQSDTLADDSPTGLDRQRVETEQVAVNPMVATTQEANRLTDRGRDIAGETRDAIQRLSVVVGELD